MKRCAILFALLLLTLMLAIWTENRETDIPLEEVALEQGNANLPSGNAANP